MQRDLGLTPLTEGLVTSTLLFGAAFGAITAGRLSDRLGRRRTIMGLALIFAVATIACSLAPTTELLVLARIVTQNELMIVTGQFLAFKNAAARQPVSL